MLPFVCSALEPLVSGASTLDIASEGTLSEIEVLVEVLHSDTSLVFD